MNTTYTGTIVIFIPVFAAFGQSFAGNYLSTLEWVRTVWYLKLIRTVLMVGILALIGWF
jgi:hypothetical protein